MVDWIYKIEPRKDYSSICKENAMVRGVFSIFFFALVGSSIFADPINITSAQNCIAQVKHFTTDYDSYYKMRVEVTGVSGRVYDSNQITVRLDENEIFYQILYNNEVFIRVLLTKSPTKYDDSGDIVAFSYSPRLGFTTVYTKTYSTNASYEIPYIFINLFEAFNVE
jgi:hypothetical protein